MRSTSRLSYFEALQIPVLAGRSFTDADGPDAQRVAIVNQTFVRKFFHGANPVGRYVDKDTRIVGVVEDVAIAPGVGSCRASYRRRNNVRPCRANGGQATRRCFTSGSSQAGSSAPPLR